MKLIKLLIITVATFGMVGNPAFAKGKDHAKSIPRTSITFDSGSAMLTEADKGALRKLIRDAEAQGKIEQVTVASWSDKALPHQGQKLLDDDRNLAEMRAEAIEDFLEDEMDIADVDTYNMAETANWLARTFDTRDAELKSAFGLAGAETPLTKEEFHVIKKEGGPSMAVAVVEFANTNAVPTPTLP